MTSDAAIICGESRRSKRSGESDNEKKLFHSVFSLFCVRP
jgi:hypothetical protein